MIRRARWFPVVSLASLVAISGCSGGPPPAPPVVPIADAPAPDVRRATVPDEVRDLAQLIPMDAAFVVELPDVAKVADRVPADQRALIALGRPFLEGGAADKLGIDSRVVHELVDAFERAAAFGDTKSAALVARFGTREPVDKLLASMEALAKESVPGARATFSPPGAPSQRLVWYPRPRILVWASSPDAAARVERAATGETPAFAKHARRLPDDPAALRFYADLGGLAAGEAEAKGLVDRGSYLRGDLAYGDAGLQSKIELSLVGGRLPRLSGVLERGTPALAARLPEETLLFSSASLARKPGRTLRDLIEEVARASGGPGVADGLDGLMKREVGLGLDDLDALLGGELTTGLAAAPNARIDTNDPGKNRFEDMALVVLAGSRDDARAKRLVAAAGQLAKKGSLAKEYKVVATPTALRLTPLKAGAPAMRFEAHKGALVFEVGGATWMDRVGRALDQGERTLGASAGYRGTAATLAKPANGFLWLDLDRTSKAFSQSGSAAAASSKVGVARALLMPSDAGIDLTIEGQNGAEAFAIGTLAAVGIYGVRRYLSSAKAAEAKNTVGAISRAAVAAYEREQPGSTGQVVVHKLCKSASAVPARVPAGQKHQPSTAPGRDFDTGDGEAGWRCLKFAMSAPHYYQYEYRRGGPYKGPPRGGPDPGPDGFEVSAEGDLDGNGKTSLFTRIGKVDKVSGTIRLSTEIFVSDEHE